MTFSFSQERLRLRLVLAGRFFGDDAFQPHLPSGLQDFVALHGEMFGNLNAIARRHDLGERAFAIDQRHIAQIVAIPIEQIEREELHRSLAGQMSDFVCVRLMNSRLNQSEPRSALLIQYSDLGIENGVLRGELCGITLSSGYCRSNELPLRDTIRMWPSSM